MKDFIISLRWHLFIISFFLISSIHTAHSSLIESAHQTRPSIVHIKAVKTILHASPQTQATISPKSGKILLHRPMATAHKTQMGAGVIVSADGFIVTNLHVVNQCQHIFVKIFNNQTFTAKVIHINPHDDLALLKITPKAPLHAIPLANIYHSKIGDEVLHIGSSSLLKETLSGGHITGLGAHQEKGQPIIDIIQVNLDIYKGDSGGPLLNRQDELLGMMTAKRGDKEKASLAIPVNKIKKIYWDLMK